MLLQTFHKLHTFGRVMISKTRERNPISSATDPTQDCPVRSFVFDAAGNPVGVGINPLPFSGVPINAMTAIESRLRDKFDVVGDMQNTAKKVRGIKGLKTSKVN